MMHGSRGGQSSMIGKLVFAGLAQYDTALSKRRFSSSKHSSQPTVSMQWGFSMVHINVTMLFVALLACMADAHTREKYDIVVAKDGSGRYRTIQEALEAVPKNNEHLVVILVKNGVYNEKLFITKSNVAIVGEDRDSTKIVYAELRENWNKDHYGNDWGSGVVNIDSATTDLTLANLTVHNNYGSLHSTNKHQFAIRGWGTRIIILNCNVIADGGDTVSLWNRENGMYYHAYCYFEGWVDYVCPRGWCYITDSKFFGRNLSASIWHDGSYAKDQKFVIRSSFFDGVAGFPLGRHHRDAQIYLLDCVFSKTMADRPIYSPKSPNVEPWKWGTRHYFYNCLREGVNFEWSRDNLAEAEGSPKEYEITAQWTFGGRWNPEEAMPAVLPFVVLPRPRDGSKLMDYEKVDLRWTPARNAVLHNIYFGTVDSLEFMGTQESCLFRIQSLKPRTTYCWRIDEVTPSDTVKGPTWHFTTQ
jgi:pectinesterase